MNAFKNIVFIIILTFCQIILSSQISFFQKSSLNLIVIGLFFLSLKKEGYSGYLGALLGGLFFDLYSAYPLGTNTFVFIVLVYFIYLVRENFLRRLNSKLFIVLATFYVGLFFGGKFLVLSFLGLKGFSLQSFFTGWLLNLSFILLISFLVSNRFLRITK